MRKDKLPKESLRDILVVVLVLLATIVMIGMSLSEDVCKDGRCATPSVAQVETAGWQTFRSHLGFEIQYPPNWEAEEAPSNGNIRTAFLISKDDPNKNIEISWHNRSTLEMERETRQHLIEEASAIPGSIWAYIYRSAEDQAFYNIVASRALEVYTISTGYYTDPQVKKMLSTLRFLGNSEDDASMW